MNSSQTPSTLLRYRTDDEIGPLTDWPFDNPDSDYVINAGTPRASGRIETGGPGHNTRMGIWACTAGTFTCTEQGDELMTILSGHGSITDIASGVKTAFAPGDTLFSHDGSRVIWNITADVVKVFHGYNADGF